MSGRIRDVGMWARDGAGRLREPVFSRHAVGPRTRKRGWPSSSLYPDSAPRSSYSSSHFIPYPSYQPAPAPASLLPLFIGPSVCARESLLRGWYRGSTRHGHGHSAPRAFLEATTRNRSPIDDDGSKRGGSPSERTLTLAFLRLAAAPSKTWGVGGWGVAHGSSRLSPPAQSGGSQERMDAFQTNGIGIETRERSVNPSQLDARASRDPGTPFHFARPGRASRRGVLIISLRSQRLAPGARALVVLDEDRDVVAQPYIPSVPSCSRDAVGWVALVLGASLTS
ncbi:hypothetical protein OF83DRAFT_104646 [Amylostereum chailletii]|nr:hypothetical protein OF83DRAFT_104646 [Amylostereum chailletii]